MYIYCCILKLMYYHHRANLFKVHNLYLLANKQIAGKGKDILSLWHNDIGIIMNLNCQHNFMAFA